MYPPRARLINTHKLGRATNERLIMPNVIYKRLYRDYRPPCPRFLPGTRSPRSSP